MKRTPLTPLGNDLEQLVLPRHPRILVPFVTGNKLPPHAFLRELRDRFPTAHLALATPAGMTPPTTLTDEHLELAEPRLAGWRDIARLTGRMRAARYDLCFLPEEEIYGPDFGSLKKYLFILLSGCRYALTGTLRRNRLVSLAYGIRALANQALFFFLRDTPLNLQVEATNFCNLRCPLCPSGRGLLGERGTMNPVNYRRLLDEVGDSTETLALYNLGEPLLHPQLAAMIALAKQKNIFVRIDSNLSLPVDAEALVASGLDVIQVAVDGAAQESYAKYRKNGNLAKVIDNIGRLVAARKKLARPTPQIVLKFIVMRHNEHEIEQARALAERLEVDHFSVEGVTIPSFAGDAWHEFLPSQEHYSKYDQTALRERGELVFKSARPSNHCFLGLHGTLVLWNGEVKACCRNSYLSHSFGNAFDDGGLRAVWTSRPYRRFRKQLKTDRTPLRDCRGCWV